MLFICSAKFQICDLLNKFLETKKIWEISTCVCLCDILSYMYIINYKYQLIVDHCSICTFHGTSTYFAKTTLQLLSQTDCRLLRQLVDAGGTLPSIWNWIRFPTLKAPGFSDFTKTNTENSRKASSISEKKTDDHVCFKCIMWVFTTQNLDPTTTTSTR